MPQNIILVIQNICYIIKSLYEGLKRLITLRNEQQQIEYIYELYFHNNEVDGQKIKEIFKWLDNIKDRNEFKQLKIKNLNYQDLEIFYLEMAAIQESSKEIKELQNGIFLCLVDFNSIIDKDLRIYNDDNNQIYQDQEEILINQDNNMQQVFEKIQSYAQARFGQEFQKRHLNKIFGRPFFTEQLYTPLELQQFSSKQLDIKKFQQIILTNNIMPKDISKMEDGDSIVEEILRVERLLQSQFKLNPKHINYIAMKMFKIRPNLEQLTIKQQLANTLLENIRIILEQQPENWQNNLGEFLSQINEMKQMAENYKWKNVVTNIQHLLNQQVNQDWLNQIMFIIEQILQRIERCLEFFQNFQPLNSDYKSWIQLFKDTKTKWQFQQFIQNNRSLLFHKKEFIDILQQIL